MRFNPRVVDVSGKQQIVADALSRAPVGKPEEEDYILVEEVESYASEMLGALPVTTDRLEEIRAAQKTDEECSIIRKYCVKDWPTYRPIQPLMQPY